MEEHQGLTAIDDAIDRAVHAMCGRQRPDGSWTTPGDVGPASTAQALVALRAAGDRHDMHDDAARWLAARQRDDGGFDAWPGAPRGDPGVTVTALAALTGAGDAYERARARARRFVDARGGVGAVVTRLPEGELGGVFAVAAGLAPRPRSAPVHGLVAPWLLPRWTRRVHAGVPMMAACWRAVALGPDAPASLSRRLERRWSLALLDGLQNEAGHWNGTVFQTSVAMVALAAMGVSRDDPRLLRAATWLRAQRVHTAEGSWYPSFWLPVWSTVFAGRALVASGRASARQAIERGARWLLDARCAGPQSVFNQPDPDAPRRGGWAFIPGNDTMPDSDDTGAVLSFLGASGARDACVVREGVAWLGGMQHPNGGWASYTAGLPAKPRGAMLGETFRPRDALARWMKTGVAPLALGDPPTEDVTARVLEGLGAVGHRVGEARVDRALAFLRAQQLDDGSWWGRWMLNYIAATAFVVMGACAVGVPSDAPWIARALAWLCGRQRADGGFGEDAASYRDPARAGVGAPCAALTGLGLSALCAAGLGRAPAAAAAARWLLARQRPDGAWPRDGYLTPLLLPDSFYVHEESTSAYALEGLARWVSARREARP